MSEQKILNEANNALQILRQKRNRLSEQLGPLRPYADWRLKKESTRKTSAPYYDGINKTTGQKKYLGGETSEDVLNVKRYRYAQKAVSVLDRDIELLDSLVNGYICSDYDSINDLLPATYRTQVHSSSSLAAGMPSEAIEWKKKLEEEKVRYAPYRPEQLMHPSMDGTLMRSKSEVIIANILIHAGIPFVYESPLFINGKNMLPDFRILSLIDLKTEIIIEHQGMVFVDEYSNKFIRSLRLYLQTDWIPNQNLFFTFDNAKEILDTDQVFSILRKYVDPSI